MNFCKGFDILAIGERMPDSRVSGSGFHQMKRTRIRAINQRALDTAVLIAERNLKMENLLAMTLKAEMPRFDDAGMNRPDGDLMDFFAFDTIEIGDARNNRRFGRSIPAVFVFAIRMMKANRLQPGMTQRMHTPLFRQFAFEPVSLRASGRQG